MSRLGSPLSLSKRFHTNTCRCTKIVEDDLYLGNADKLMFLMNEFKAHLSPELIKTHSNPILVGKLDP
jgi:hypothetical protein